MQKENAYYQKKCLRIITKLRLLYWNKLFFENLTKTLSFSFSNVIMVRIIQKHSKAPRIQII